MTKADQSTVSTTDLDEAIAALGRKEALDPALPEDLRFAAAAGVIRKAGKAVSPRAAKPKAVLSALGKLDTLAGLDTSIRTYWLAVRALALPAGAQIGLRDTLLENPVMAVMIEAAAIVPTTDFTEVVNGIIGDFQDRDVDTLAAGGRVVDIDATGLTVSNGTGTLFSVDTTDFDAAVALVDSKAVSRASRTDKIGPVSYNVTEAAELSDFATTIFSSYRVRRIEIPGAKVHPTELVESAALASVVPPAPTYQPHFHPDIIRKGVLSDVQLEAVIYAGEAHSKYLQAHPDDDKKIPPRQGFLVGHGTGFGKGRTIAAIIADNWVQNRRRHIWFSESAHLIDDARRDWAALGGKPEEVIDIRDIAAGTPIPPFNGIIFATYASLRLENENGSRLKQLVNWFGHGEEGVIAFDEAQNLRNARNKNSKSSEISLQGLAALDIQDRLPNARVTYVSATSASDIASIGFAVRLGLWGAGTAFRNAKRFFDEMEEGGTNALEMVARDLKAMGLYLAANLSFDGVKYERLQRKLTDAERSAQDRLSALWLEIGDGLNRAMRITGASRLPGSTKGRVHRMGSIHFAMSRARFFQALLASLNTPQMIEKIREDLANGHSAIIQMTNTFAANAERAIAEAEDQGNDISSIEASARDILVEFLRHGFPIHKVQAVRKNKKTWSELVLDAQGNPIEEPKAIAIRDQLLQEVEKVSVPEGPLEQILRAFGSQEVAEITGRSRRLVPAANGSQTLEDRYPEDVKADLRDFVNDDKRILVFSQAGGTGATYSAQRTFRNQRLRRHYLLQPGWRADLALQGMGRSHRSDQVQPPEYILLSTDLWANQRMISAVAKGMRDLGALTRGLRQAASQEFFTGDENLEDEFGETAWFNFAHKMASGQINGMSIAQFERESCITLRNPSKSALKKPLPPVRRFLNAMSAMSCDNQALFGQHYRQELQDLKLAAIEEGTFDRGIETIVPDNLIKLDDQVIFRDARTGGETRLLKMLRIDTLNPVTYADARRKAMTKGNTRIVKSIMTGRIAILCFPRIAQGRMPSADDKVEIIMPTGSRVRTREEVVQERWAQVDVTLAESLWAAELKERGDEEEHEFWVISGAMLPIWDKLPRQRSTVYRMESDEGEQIIGRLVSEDFVSNLLNRVDAVSSGGLPLNEVDESLLDGGVATLANGWVLEGRYNRITGRQSILLSIPLEDKAAYAAVIQNIGLKAAYGPLTSTAYFKVPLEDGPRQKALSTILSEAPAVSTATL